MDSIIRKKIRRWNLNKIKNKKGPNLANNFEIF